VWWHLELFCADAVRTKFHRKKSPINSSFEPIFGFGSNANPNLLWWKRKVYNCGFFIRNYSFRADCISFCHADSSHVERIARLFCPLRGCRRLRLSCFGVNATSGWTYLLRKSPSLPFFCRRAQHVATLNKRRISLRLLPQPLLNTGRVGEVTCTGCSPFSFSLSLSVTVHFKFLTFGRLSQPWLKYVHPTPDEAL